MSHIVLGLVVVIMALLISLLVRRLRPAWTPRRIGMVSAAIVPIIIIALSLFVFFSAGMASPERCGPQACRLARSVASVFFIAAILEFLLGWVATIYLQRWLAKR